MRESDIIDVSVYISVKIVFHKVHVSVVADKTKQAETLSEG